MSASTIDVQADKLIAEAIAAGRLSPAPSPESLNRIARIVAPVLAATPAPITVTAKKKMTARASTSPAVKREGIEIQYVRTPPKQIPPGLVLVHNVRWTGQRYSGPKGFRAYLAPPAERWISCECGFTPLPHFRRRTIDEGLFDVSKAPRAKKIATAAKTVAIPKEVTVAAATSR